MTVLHSANHSSRAAALAAPVPAPAPGRGWDRLTRGERAAAVRAAVARGATMSSLATDHGLNPGMHGWRLLRSMWAGHLENVAQYGPSLGPSSAGSPPGPGVLIGALREGVCRWPLWGSSRTPGPAEALYCGAPTQTGRVYCPTCTARSRRDRPVRADIRPYRR